MQLEGLITQFTIVVSYTSQENLSFLLCELSPIRSAAIRVTVRFQSNLYILNLADV